MKQSEINGIPFKIRQGLINEKEAVYEMCSFVNKNYPVFGIQLYDEDLRQDIMLDLMEKGSHILHMYNPELGDFFTYFYCFICTFINTRTKKHAADSVREQVNLSECILELEEKADKYNKIDYTSLELPKVPYSYKRIDPKDFRQAVQELSLDSNEKKVIILALKSSYYLTDDQIKRICRMYNIRNESFYPLIQHCKNTLYSKMDKRHNFIKRRNYAYFHHKRCTSRISQMDENNLTYKLQCLKEEIEYKEKKHYKNWNKLNTSFEKGFLYLRPSTKTVANLMGICERQVNYYLHSAKRDYEKLEQKLKPS